MLLRLKTTSWERLASASTDSTIPYFATYMQVCGKPIVTGIIMLLSYFRELKLPELICFKGTWVLWSLP